MTEPTRKHAEIRLAIVDDHDLVREGIVARLENQSHIIICGEGENGREAIDLAKKFGPDVMLLDISMPQMNGLVAAPAVKEASPDTRILFLSIYDNPEYVSEALRAGVTGYILKDVSREEMITAIEAVAKGCTYLGPQLAPSLVNEQDSALEKPCAYGLTEREKEVLTGIANGKANKRIAADLDISVRTVESHRASLRDKTGGGNAAALARIAREIGI